MKALIIGIFFCSVSFGYQDYRRNENLKEELDQQPYRVLPHNDVYSFALDAEIYKPYFPTDNPIYETDYNHGAGYWLDFRSEVKVKNSLIFNSKLVFTEGTSSFGPIEKSVILPFIGFSYQNYYNENHGVRMRIIDMGRMTIGNGLIIEQKDTNGGRLSYFFGEHELSFLVDATGSFRIDGGIYAFLFHERNDQYGMYTLLQEEIGFHYLPIFSIYGNADLMKEGPKSWTGGAELALNREGESFSGLLFTQYEDQWGAFKYHFKPQVRYYGRGLIGNVPGHLEQGYVAYEQNDKPYTTLMNIFTIDDHVLVGALQTRLDYQFNSFYSAFLDSEVMDAHYYDVGTFFYPFYKLGMEFSLLNGDQCKVGFFTGNKFLTTSDTFSGATGLLAMTLPNQNHTENKPLFLKIQHIGAFMTAKF